MIFFNRGFFKVGTEDSVQFWEDTWLDNTSLAQQYPSLYNIMQRKKNVSVAIVLAQTPINITFRRNINDKKWTQWLHLCQHLMRVQLSNNPDKFAWKLNDSGIFLG
jgi:hypothetical protein